MLAHTTRTMTQEMRTPDPPDLAAKKVNEKAEHCQPEEDVKKGYRAQCWHEVERTNQQVHEQQGKAGQGEHGAKVA